MPASTSRLSFIDCFDVFDKALLAERGLKLKFPDEGGARSMRRRLMRARVIDRDDNAETYPPGHELHGRSEYDRLQVSLRQNGEGWALFIEPIEKTMEIEEL